MNLEHALGDVPTNRRNCPIVALLPAHPQIIVGKGWRSVHVISSGRSPRRGGEPDSIPNRDNISQRKLLTWGTVCGNNSSSRGVKMKLLSGGDRYFPHLFKRFSQFGALFGSPIESIKLQRIVAAARARSHTARGSRNGIKYVGDYLSLGMSRQERLKSIKHHYEFMGQYARHVRVSDGITLWTLTDDEEKSHELRLQCSLMAPMEGEAELCYILQDERLFTLTFSFMDGNIVGYKDAPVIFVGGLQGAYFAREKVRYSARKNGEIAPAMMLILAVYAVADAFGIQTVVGPSNAKQIASRKSVDGRSSSLDYNDLWRRCGGLEDYNGHYHIPVLGPSTSQSEISGVHRARTRRRRKKKMAIRATMLRRVAASLKGDAVFLRPETTLRSAINPQMRPIDRVSESGAPQPAYL